MPQRTPGTLYVVATPIGNLEDVTLRALRVLREVELIAAEDTRRTARLLQHYSISTATTSLHEHNERRKLPSLLGRLGQGASIALVSDAGTPTISDPGARLIQAARDAGVRIQAVPGPSAVTTAVTLSGVSADAFLFAGFAPRKSKGRRTWLADIARETRPVVFFETPHRIRSLLEDLLKYFGDRPIVVARELTKIHEETLSGSVSDILNTLQNPRGEFTIIIPTMNVDAEAKLGQITMITPPELAVEYRHLTNNGVSRRTAIKQIAAKYHLSPKAVFSRLEEAKKIGLTT